MFVLLCLFSGSIIVCPSEGCRWIYTKKGKGGERALRIHTYNVHSTSPSSQSHPTSTTDSQQCNATIESRLVHIK